MTTSIPPIISADELMISAEYCMYALEPALNLVVSVAPRGRHRMVGAMDIRNSIGFRYSKYNR